MSDRRELSARLGSVAELERQRDYVGQGALFLPASDPPPQPLETLEVHLFAPHGGHVSVTARVVQVSAATMALAPLDAAAATSGVQRLVDEARAAGEVPPGPTRIAWGGQDPGAAELGSAATDSDPAAPEPAATDAAAPEATNDPLAEHDDAATKALYDQIREMSAPDKMKLAAHGDRAARLLLMKDTLKVVHVFVLQNPRITIEEVIHMAGSSHTSPDALQMIGKNAEWMSNPRAAAALVRNPKTPPALAVRLLDRLPPAEIRRLAKSADAPRAVGQAAKKKVLGGET